MNNNIRAIVAERFESIGIKITNDKLRDEVYEKAEEAVVKAADGVLKPKLLTKLLVSVLRGQKAKEAKPHTESLQ